MKKHKFNITDLGFKIFAYTFLIVLSALVLVPFLYAFTGSFKTSMEILISPDIFPEQWNFDNYINAWTNADFSKYTFNSAWYAAGCVVISVFTSTINGYVFARGNFRGKELIFKVFTSMMFITLGTSSMYPTIQILKLLGLNTNLWGLLIKLFFGIHITNVFLVRGFMNGIPKSLDEAATIDGCDFIQTFFRVILPLLKPIIATVAIFAFTSAWNDYLYPMVVTLSNPAQRPLSVGLIALKSSGEAAAAWNIILAGGMMSALPMVLVFLVFNRYFIKGLTSGAVKE